MHSHCKLVSREVGGCWGVETGVAATPWWRSIETGTVSAPRAGSREHQGKREHWPVMATKYAYLGLHPYWVDSWGACEYRISCTGYPTGLYAAGGSSHGVGRRLADRHPVLHSRDPVPWCYIPSRPQANRGRDPIRSTPGSAP